MRIRFRIGPFTFGKTAARLSPWSGGTGFSIPLSNRKKNKSYGKVKMGPVSFHFTEKKRKQSAIKEKRNTPTICPNCSGKLLIRNGKYGPFYGCSNYPNCKFTQSF